MIFLLGSFLWADQLLYEGDLGQAIDDLVLSENEEYVAFIGSEMSYVLSTSTWELTSISVCGTYDMGGAVFVDTDLFIGCADGSISTYSDDGESKQNALTIDADEILGLWEVNDIIYALAEQESGGNPRVHSVEISSNTEASGNYPSTLGYSNYKDGEVFSNYLVVSHGGSSISKVDLSTGAASTDNTGPTSVTLTDVLPLEGATNVLVAGGDGGIVRFLMASNDTQYALNLLTFTDITALAVQQDLLWIADENVLRAHSVSSYGGTVGSEEEDSITLSDVDTIKEMAAIDGYLFFVSENGSYGVLSDLPKVEIASLSSNWETDEHTLIFVSDTSEDYALYFGSDTSGELLASGSVTAEQETTVTFSSSNDFIEGENQLWLAVGGGHDSLFVSVDQIPEQVALTDASLGSGNESFTLSFTGLAAADIDYYQVYLTTEEFVAADYETGGPSFEVLSQEELQMPVSDTPRLTISPLANNMRYYVAVRAYDKGGQEGPMSDIISGIPEESISASQLAGETGGYCSTTAKTGALSLIGIALLGLFRRRRTIAAAAFLFCLSGTANAADLFGEREPISSSFGFGYKASSFDSEVLQLVFGDGVYPGLTINGGVEVYRFLRVEGTIGFIQQMGLLVKKSDQTSSTEHDMLSILPVSLQATVRLDVFNQQPIIPFVSGGIDYWLWRENWEISDVDDEQGGGKTGFHYTVGAEILLDSFDPSSASLLDVRYGIQDTYLTIGYETREIGSEGLLFHGTAVNIGFQFVF